MLWSRCGEVEKAHFTQLYCDGEDPATSSNCVLDLQIATVLECMLVSGQDLDYAGPYATQASSKRFLFCEERHFVYLFAIISLVLSSLPPHHFSLLVVSISLTAYVPGLPPSLHFSQSKHPQAWIVLTQPIFYHQATLWVSQLDGCSG